MNHFLVTTDPQDGCACVWRLQGTLQNALNQINDMAIEKRKNLFLWGLLAHAEIDIESHVIEDEED